MRLFVAEERALREFSNRRQIDRNKRRLRIARLPMDQSCQELFACAAFAEINTVAESFAILWTIDDAAYFGWGRRQFSFGLVGTLDNVIT
jgi:hypothetical protein